MRISLQWSVLSFHSPV